MTSGASRWLEEHKADIATLLAMEGEKNCLLELAEQLGHIGHWRVSLPDYALTWSTEVYHIHSLTPDRYTPEIKRQSAFIILTTAIL
jgi:hypothetical protein